MVKKYKQRTKSSRAKLVRSLANTTKGGKGPIKKRAAYRKRV